MSHARLIVLLIAAAALSVVSAQEPAAPAAAAEWPMYNRDLRGTRHSPLTQITPANVSRLRQVWSYKLGKASDTGGLTGGTEFTPIVVRGVMYVSTATSVVALAPETGREIWKYDLPKRLTVEARPRLLARDGRVAGADPFYIRATARRARRLQRKTDLRLRRIRLRGHGADVQRVAHDL
jgi:glucose dehydrogenase